MRSDAGFDRFITEELKEAAGRVEVPARCKTEIDMRIVSAESDQQTGGTKQMRNWTFRKSVAELLLLSRTEALNRLSRNMRRLTNWRQKPDSRCVRRKSSRTDLYLQAEGSWTRKGRMSRETDSHPGR